MPRGKRRDWACRHRCFQSAHICDGKLRHNHYEAAETRPLRVHHSGKGADRTPGIGPQIFFSSQERRRPKNRILLQQRMIFATNSSSIDPLSFGPIRFLMCYAAAGPLIRFYALDGSPEAAKSPNKLIELTPLLSFRTAPQRLEILCAVLNIGRVVVTIQGMLPKQGLLRLEERKRISDYCFITTLRSEVIKEIREVRTAIFGNRLEGSSRRAEEYVRARQRFPRFGSSGSRRWTKNGQRSQRSSKVPFTGLRY